MKSNNKLLSEKLIKDTKGAYSNLGLSTSEFLNYHQLQTVLECMNYINKEKEKDAMLLVEIWHTFSYAKGVSLKNLIVFLHCLNNVFIEALMTKSILKNAAKENLDVEKKKFGRMYKGIFFVNNI